MTQPRPFASLKPLFKETGLAKTPRNKLKYSQTVKSIKGQTVELADPRATRALVALMNQHAVIGGAAAHWGGPAAFAEIMSAVHAIMFNTDPDKHEEWFEKYHFVNDAGHTENGIYALRANYGFDGMTFEHLKEFRSLGSKLTGHGEAHLNPEGVLISNGPLGSGIPQAQGLALADKILNNDRTTVCALSDGGAMEGEAKEALAAIPGLAALGKLNPFLLLISDNNTKLSGRIDKDAFSMHPTFKALEVLGWKTHWEEEGHNLQKVYTQIENALQELSDNPTKPVAIVFKTIKGMGVRSTMESSSGGHGYPLKPRDSKLLEFLREIYQPAILPAEFEAWASLILNSKNVQNTNHAFPLPPELAGLKKEKVQIGFSKAAASLVEAGIPLFSLTSDLPGSTGIGDFIKKYPGHHQDLGVAEANMISSAIGLSRLGLIPVVDTFCQFAITKGNLPLIMSGLSLGPVIGLFSHTGFQDAADGASHQATTYFSATASLPHTCSISVSCSAEAEFFFTQAVQRFKADRESGKLPNSSLFFFGRENFVPDHGQKDWQWGKAQVLRQGKDLCLVATGPTVELALMAHQALLEEGIEVSVVNNIFVSQVDSDTIWQQVQKSGGKMITVEDHQVIGGMGSLVIHALMQKGHQFKAKSLGIGGEYGQSAYMAEQLYHKHHFDAEGIIKAVKQLL